MSTIVTRAGKGSPLTNNEVDANFVNLNTDKIESITSVDGSVVITPTGTTRDLSVGTALNTATLISQVRNETGATLTKGTVVYVSGASSNKALVSKALANADATSAQTYGVIQADISNNQNGYVVVIGVVSGLNTSAFANGTQLYLSGTTAGTYTSTKPYAPIHLVYVGIVTYSHVNQGTIEVKIQNGYELDEIHNVSAQSPTTGQTLVYNASTSLWEKNTVSLTAGVNGTLPVANGGTGITSFGSGVATFLGTPSSANLASAVTDETGTGALVFANTPTLVTPILGTPTSATLTNATGLPLTTGVTGVLPTANGGTNLSSFTSGGVVYASSTSALATGSALTFDGTNLSSTGGATFQGGPIGYGGGEIRLGSTSASLQNGISTQGTGTPQIIFDHRGTSNTGTFTWRNGTGGANTLLFLGATGNMQLNTTTNKTTAFSGNGSGLTIGAALAPTLALYDTTNTTYVFNLTQIEADTYLYNTANGAMAFGTNNAEGMRLTTTGLGIGTSSPARKLDLLGSGAVFTAITSSDANQVGLLFGISGTANQANITYSATGLQVSTGTALPIIFNTNGSERSRIDSTGNFFIGTTTNTNTSKLVVNGTISQTVGGTQYLVVDQSDIGTGANEIPLNQYLGNLAYEDNTNLPSVGVGAGTAALPSVFSATDNDTGFWFPAANTLAASVNGAEQFRLTTTGLGIGTSSPAYPLDIGTSQSAETIARVLNSSTNASAASIFRVQNSTSNLDVGIRSTGSGAFGALDANSAYFGYNGSSSLVLFASNASAVIKFATGGSAERARIDSLGNLVVGTTSAGNGKISLAVASGGGWFSSRTGGLTENLFGSDGSGNASIYTTGGTHTINFYTNAAERARIDSAGNLLVGTTDSNPNSGDGVKMNAGTGARTSIVGAADTNANFAITVYSRSPSAYRFQVGYGGTIYATSTSITAISDQTLKTNVRDLETGLTEVMALQPRRFDWINGDASNVAGFIAQEVQQVLPDLVEDYQYSDEETKLGLKMGDILPTLVKAIQEQQAIIQQLQADVAALKG